MRGHASLGALAGIAWVASAAVVPRFPQIDLDSTCTSTTTQQQTVVVTVPRPTPTATFGPATIVTVTLDPGDPGPSSGSADALPGFDSSTCTSSGTLLSIGQDSSGTAAAATVTLTALPTPPKSTVTVPVVTVTVPRGSGTPVAPEPTITAPPDNGGPTVPVVTVTIPETPGVPGSGATVTVTLPGVPTSGVTVTVPAQPANSAGSVLTVTIPEGPDNTATVVLTVTVPNSGSPGSWSTVVTGPGNPSATVGPVVTVTFTNSQLQGVTTTIPIPAPSGGTVASGPNPSPITIETVTIPLSGLPGAGSPTGTGAIATLTLTLGTEAGFPTPYTTTVTITPGSSLPSGVPWPVGSGNPGQPAVVTVTEGVPPTVAGSFAGSTPPAASTSSSCNSSPSIQLVTYTMTPQGTTPGYTAVFTMTFGPSDTWPAWSPPATQPGVLTVTQPAATVSVFPMTIPLGEGSLVTTLTVTIPASAAPTASNGQFGSSPSVSGTSPLGGQQTLVTVTIPQGSPNSGPGVVTVTIPQGSPSSQPSTVQPIQTSPAAPGQSQVITVTLPGASGVPPSVYTVTVPALGSSVLSPPGTYPPTPSSPSWGTSVAPTGSVAVVTYTAPAKSGGSPSLYTVTYTLHPSGPLSNTPDSGYSSPTTPSAASGPSPAGISPVTVTLGAVSGTPVIITYTPSATATSPQTPGPAIETVTVPVSGVNTLSQPAGVTAVTVTLPPTAPGSPPVVVTYTPSPSAVSSPTPQPTDGGLGYGSGGAVATTVITVTPVTGSPFVITVTQAAPAGATPAWSPSGSGPDGGVATTVITVTPTIGSPFVVTVTQEAPATATPVGTPSGSGPGPTVVTIPLASGSSTVITLPGSPITSTLPAGEPAVVTVTESLPSGSPSGNSPPVTVVTVTPESGAPLTITLPAGTPTGPDGYPGILTVTDVTTPAVGGGVSVTVVTVTPISGSPITVTVPVGTAAVPTNHPGASPSVTGQVITVHPAGSPPFTITVPGVGPDATVTKTIESSIAPVLTITQSAGPSVPGSGQTVVVSDLTLTETLPIGSGHFTVVEITTQVTVTRSSGISSPTASQVLVTPAVVTYTIPSAYGIGPTVVTYTTYLPVASATPADAGVTTLTLTTTPLGGSGTRSGSPSLGSPQVITIWPTGAYGSQDPFATPIIVTIDPNSVTGSLSPTVVTIWPSLTTLATSVTPTSCSLDGDGPTAASNTDAFGTSPGRATPSVITIWPTGSPTDSTCTTLSTRLRSSGGFGGSDPTATSARFSVITLLSTIRGTPPLGTSSSTCTESSQGPLTSNTLPPVATNSVPAFISSIASELASTTAAEPVGQSIGISEEPTTAVTSSDELPPPQTELHQHGASVLTDAFSLTDAELTSTAQGYGNPVPMYGTTAPVPLITTSPTTVSPLPIMSTISPTSVSSPGSSASGALPLSGTTTSSEALPSVSTTPEISPSANSTMTSAPTSANATIPSALPSVACGSEGDRGEVVFQFDDIPTIHGGNATDPNSTHAQPVPFPYHRFYFSNGFDLASPEDSRYAPSSGTQMVRYNTSASPTAQIGLAALRVNPCMRFDFLGIGLGCNSTDLPCVFDIRGLQWNGVDEALQANRTFEISACPDSSNCTLRHQLLDSAAATTFSNLTAINITLTVGGEPQTWWGDDLQIAWTDNDCTAAACRARVPNTIMRVAGRRSSNPFRWPQRRRHTGRY